MRWPARFRLRTLIVAIAVFAVLLAVFLRNPQWWPRQLHRWQREWRAYRAQRAMMAWLDRPVTLHHPQPTPLEDVMLEIKRMTDEPDLPRGMPIYIDPVGREETGTTMTSPVTVDVKGVPLKKALHVMLDPLGLTFEVQDGLMTVTSKKLAKVPIEP